MSSGIGSCWFPLWPDVLTWFELRTATAGPLAIVNWSHVEDSRIIRIRVTFDPRPLLP